MGVVPATFRVVHKSEALSMANAVYQEVVGDDGFTPKDWLEVNDIDHFLGKLVAPQKNTILHDYISEIYSYHMKYIIDKHLPYEVIDSIIDLFETYDPDNLEYKKLSLQYSDYEVDYKELEARDKHGEIVDFRLVDELGYSFLKLLKKA